MAVKIGIPRALWFYDYYPLWQTFYEELGAEVILSSPTNKKILDDGVKNTVDEVCLPVKIFHGHVLDLKDKVDYIFLPKIMSVYEGEYICPKFCGLPEMIVHSIEDLPPLIDTEINFNKSRKNLLKTMNDLAGYVTKNPVKIRRAYIKAIKAYTEYKSKIKEGKLPIDGHFGHSIPSRPTINISIMGHPYNIYDSYASMGLLYKLREKGVNLITPENIGYNVINSYTDNLPKKMFWSYGRKLLGTAMHLSNEENIDGIIYLSSFGCGVDSIIETLVEKHSRKRGKIPFLLITVDEHTGEAGVDTRLEAFIDMIEWRKKNEGNLSTHG